jgi:hypothetical protein
LPHARAQGAYFGAHNSESQPRMRRLRLRWRQIAMSLRHI